MRTKDELKLAVCEAIDRRREEIIGIGDHILRNPETGFKEVHTSRLVTETMERLGLDPVAGLAVTGVKGRLAVESNGPSLALIGELDSLKVSEHPLADRETHAAHACGHNAQIAGMLGAAMGLKDCGAADELGGNLIFFAVPAEEMIEVEYRLGLRDDGTIEYLTGKSELIRLGHFDDVDLAMMIHTSNGREHVAGLADSSNGAVIKKIRFLGRSAHAGSRPQAGINALNAANLAMTAIALTRETFYDADTIRIHPIITKGGDSVSVVPAEVTMETFVRGRTLESIRNNRAMGELFGNNLKVLYGNVVDFSLGGHRTGSTDMGDLGHIMPVIHPYLHGASGNAHSDGWDIADQQHAYVDPAKMLAMTAIDLLYGGAETARAILDRDQPHMSTAEYLEYCETMFNTTHEGNVAG
ncbi:MAG: peptidase dimerization domain-containing protein [Gammaproteobacteria bacterium]